MVEPFSLNLRKVTAKLVDIRKFRNFTIHVIRGGSKSCKRVILRLKHLISLRDILPRYFDLDCKV